MINEGNQEVAAAAPEAAHEESRTSFGLFRRPEKFKIGEDFDFRGANEGGCGGVSHPPNNFNTRSQLHFDGDKSVPLWACVYRISVYNTLS